MLIDTHAHLDMPQFDNDREDVILRAKQNNITIKPSVFDLKKPQIIKTPSNGL